MAPQQIRNLYSVVVCCFRRNLPGAETGPARRLPITRRVLAYIIISSSYTKNWFSAETVCAVAFVPPPPPRRGFGWQRVAKKPGPEPEPNLQVRPAGRPATVDYLLAGGGARSSAQPEDFVFIYLLFVFGPIRCITCCSRRTYATYSFSRSFCRPLLLVIFTVHKPNPTACRWTIVPVSRNCTNNNIKLLFTFFSKTLTRSAETCRRALLSIVVCWLHWCWAETLPTPAVMTLSPVSRRRRRSPGPVCAADTNTQCSDRTIATDKCIFRTGCLSHRLCDYGTFDSL